LKKIYEGSALERSRACAKVGYYKNRGAVLERRKALYHARDNDPKKNYYKSSRGKHAARNKQLQRLYGITLEDYDKMKAQQKGRCAICETIPKRLCVDHCHSTKRVRKLVCDLCNRAIAVLEDASLVRRVTAYLKD
jgi:hypothetical protein